MGRILTQGTAVIPALPASYDPYTWASAAAGPYGLPSGLNDGSYISNAGGNIALYNSAGAAIWTVAPAAVNANSSAGTTGLFWVDTVEGQVYAFTIDNTTTTKLYPYKVNISTGALTVLGVGFVASSYTTRYLKGIYRAAQGAGDLTILTAGYGSGGGAEQISFSSSTGAVTVALASIKISGSPIYYYGLTVPPSVIYKSSDNRILVGDPISYTASGGSFSEPAIPIFNNANANGKMGWLLLTGHGTAPVFDGGSSNFGSVGAIAAVVGSTVFINGKFRLPPMNRLQFDAWLSSCLTYLGIS